MSTMRIQDTQSPLVTVPLQPGAEAEAQKARGTTPQVNLFNRSEFQRTEPLEIDGRGVALPSWTAEDEAQANALFANVPESARPALNEASARLAAAAYNATGVVTTSAGLSSGVTDTDGSLTAAGAANPPGVSVSQASPDVAAAIRQATSTYVGATKTQDYDMTVQAVSYMGVIGLQSQLGEFAQYVHGNVQAQGTLRTDRQEILMALSEWPEGQATQQFTWHSFDRVTGKLETHTAELTAEQAKAVSNQLGDSLQTMTDMNELDQMRLQDMSQKYNQGISTISNVLKNEHDTVKSIIQNLRS